MIAMFPQTVERGLMMKLDSREQAFVDEFIINGGIASKAALAAGYAPGTAKNANLWINEECKNTKRNLPFKPYLREAIDKKLKEIDDAKTADAKEVMQYLTSVMRGESESETVVVEGQGEGVSIAKRFKKNPDEKDRLKAAELLGKVHGIFEESLSLKDTELHIKVDYGSNDSSK